MWSLIKKNLKNDEKIFVCITDLENLKQIIMYSIECKYQHKDYPLDKTSLLNIILAKLNKNGEITFKLNDVLTEVICLDCLPKIS